MNTVTQKSICFHLQLLETGKDFLFLETGFLYVAYADLEPVIQLSQPSK
jgi:hypothetical protein